jgi:hypothetical protein
MDANLERTKEMFAAMRSDGLDVSIPLRWGYFFVHGVQDPLAELAEEMEPLGYSCETFDEGDDGEWVLQLSKVEVHSAESLHQRNLKFNDLVASRGIDLYDGWDVSVPGASADEASEEA